MPTLEQKSMDEKELENLRTRTDAKLRFAEVHLKELLALPGLSGDDFDRAHQESYLYHLLGAKDAFLLELNAYYQCGLPTTNLTSGKLWKALQRVNRQSPELKELYELENDANSWLFHAKEMRDHSTHVSGVPRTFHVGGNDDGQVFLKNPKTMQEVTKHFTEDFKEWHKKMSLMLERLRCSAMVVYRSNNALNTDAENTRAG